MIYREEPQMWLCVNNIYQLPYLFANRSLKFLRWHFVCEFSGLTLVLRYQLFVSTKALKNYLKSNKCKYSRLFINVTNSPRWKLEQIIHPLHANLLRLILDRAIPAMFFFVENTIGKDEEPTFYRWYCTMSRVLRNSFVEETIPWWKVSTEPHSNLWNSAVSCLRLSDVVFLHQGYATKLPKNPFFFSAYNYRIVEYTFKLEAESQHSYERRNLTLQNICAGLSRLFFLL